MELANKVCCWLGLLRWTSALPGHSKNCKLEEGIPGGVRVNPPMLFIILAARGVLKNPKNPLWIRPWEDG